MASCQRAQFGQQWGRAVGRRQTIGAGRPGRGCHRPASSVPGPDRPGGPPDRPAPGQDAHHRAPGRPAQCSSASSGRPASTPQAAKAAQASHGRPAARQCSHGVADGGVGGRGADMGMGHKPQGRPGNRQRARATAQPCRHARTAAGHHLLTLLSAPPGRNLMPAAPPRPWRGWRRLPAARAAGRCSCRAPPRRPCRCFRPAWGAGGWSCRCPPRPRPSRWPGPPRRSCRRHGCRRCRRRGCGHGHGPQGCRQTAAW